MGAVNVLVVIITLTLSAESASVPAEAKPEIQTIILKAVERGDAVNIYFTFLGASTRGKIVRANADALTVNTAGYDADIAWSDVQPENLASAAMTCAKTGSEFLDIAKFYLANALPDKAEQAAVQARETDVSLEEQVTAFLKQLHPEEKKDLSGMIDALAPEVRTIERQISVRANHEGRPLGPTPPVAQPILFNTPEADAVVSTLQISPKDNPWNQDISKLPVHPNSDNIIASIGRDGEIAFNEDMCYVLVPPNQPKIEVPLDSKGESDKGPYPVPDNTPIEGLADQRTGAGDRHSIVVDPATMMLYEFYHMRKTDAGWTAACAAVWNMNTNNMRPRRWTSSDAAGLPIFPSIVRYDECERGMVEHAIRFTVENTRQEFLYPARHYASDSKNPNFPAMGQRLRLKADVDINWMGRHAKAVALATKKYGMFVADNGGNWRISTAPDKRITGRRELQKLKGSDFEVVLTNGEDGKPQY